MAFRPLPLPVDVPGRVFLDAMPGRLEPWPAFVAEAQRVGLTQVVCLTRLHEVASLSPAYAQAIDHGPPFGWRLLAMRDYGVAFDPEPFRQAVEDIALGLRHGEHVLLHCAAGIGRTGTVAACVLKRLGASTPQALQQVRAAGSNPQSALQSGLIELF